MNYVQMAMKMPVILSRMLPVDIQQYIAEMEGGLLYIKKWIKKGFLCLSSLCLLRMVIFMM